MCSNTDSYIFLFFFFLFSFLSFFLSLFLEVIFYLFKYALLLGILLSDLIMTRKQCRPCNCGVVRQTFKSSEFVQVYPCPTSIVLYVYMYIKVLLNLVVTCFIINLSKHTFKTSHYKGILKMPLVVIRITKEELNKSTCIESSTFVLLFSMSKLSDIYTHIWKCSINIWNI